jgi:hypothetical protein
MITIPEGMGFDQLGDDQRLITGVTRKKAKAYAVLPGTIQQKYDTDRDWAYDAAREGEAPKKFRVADMDLVDQRSDQQYITPVDSPDSIDMETQTVKIVGHDTIAPATHNPDFKRVKGIVAVPTPQDIMAHNEVEVYNSEQDFTAEGPIINIPGVPGRNTAYPGLPAGVLRQRFPKRSNMQMPDGLVYDQASNVTPGWDERDDTHEIYDQEGEAAASNMGILRVGDDVPLEQFDVIASVAASVLQAGATGYGVYSKVAQDRRQKKAIADESKQNAIMSAAMFNQQFGQAYGQSLAPGQAPTGKPGYPQTVAPFSSGGVDWLQIALFGGGALVLVGLTWFLIKD